MENLLFNSEIPFTGEKLQVLEQTVSKLNSADSQQRTTANNIMEQLKEMPLFWLMTDNILMTSKCMTTKIYCLVAIHDGVKNKWLILPENQRIGIKNFIDGYIASQLSNNSNQTYKPLLKKANSVLVEIIKKEWDVSWNTAISDLLKSSHNSQEICENNFLILKDLSQEIFEFSKNTMKSNDIAVLKQRFAKEFQSVYQICDQVLREYIKNKSSVKLSLLKGCLDTLSAFLNWMPLVYVFKTDLIENILVPMLSDKRVYLQSLKCLEQIVVIKFDDEDQETQDQIRKKLVLFISDFLQQLMSILPPNRSFETERSMKEHGGLAQSNQYDMFCHSLCQILSEFLKTNMIWMEENCNSDWLTMGQALDTIKMAITYMVQLTEINEVSIFKQTCEFWIWYSKYLVEYRKDIYGPTNVMNQQVLVMKKNSLQLIRSKLHNEMRLMNGSIYNMLLRVPKPEEILITIDENGIPKRETQRYAESTQLYETIRDIFRNYAIVNWTYFKDILEAKLNKQFDGSEWSFNNLNSLCWAVGTLSNTLSMENEKSFVVYFLRNLLQMCERKKDVESKAVIASNIMHIVSQFSRFLMVNFEFLKTVLNKLLDFMKNKFAGVQEMACNIFLKICEKCKENLAITHINPRNPMQTKPFVVTFIPDVEKHTQDLQTFQRIQFYEAVGHMISAYPDVNGQTELLIQLMSRMEVVWQQMMQGLGNLQNFMNEQVLMEICFYLQVNEKLAYCVGKPYSVYFNRSFSKIDSLYKGFYQLIQNEIANNGPNALNFFSVKKFRAVRRDLLNLLKTFVKAFKNDQKEFIDHYGALIEFMLNCYSSETPDLREPEVLLFMAESVNSLCEQMEGVLSAVMSSVLEAVLPMITADFSSYPEHRTNFFIFLQAMVNRCFQVFFAVEEDQFKIVINCVIWAIKHELTSLYEIGLDTLLCILKCLSQNSSFAQQFYKFYFLSILSDTLYVLTDGLHKNGFSLQAQILFILLNELPKLNFAIVPENNNQDNKMAVFHFISNILCTGFPNLAPVDHRKLLENVLSQVGDFKAFKIALRDYLVSLNLFTLQGE